MSRTYEIWGSDDGTSIGMIRTDTWTTEARERMLVSLGEKLLGSFRASSWKRAKARFKKWRIHHGYPE